MVYGLNNNAFIDFFLSFKSTTLKFKGDKTISPQISYKMSITNFKWANIF